MDEMSGGQRCERDDCGGPVLSTGECGTCGLECCPDGRCCEFHGEESRQRFLREYGPNPSLSAFRPTTDAERREMKEAGR